MPELTSFRLRCTFVFLVAVVLGLLLGWFSALNGNNLAYVSSQEKAVSTSVRSANRFIFHAGKHSSGGKIVRQMYNTTQLSIEDLMIECEWTLGCVGFTPDGVLKRFILPYNNWTSTTSGIYTLDSNYCELKEGHSCSRNTTKCFDRKNGTYSCIPTTPITTDHLNDRHTAKESSTSIYTDSSPLSSNIHIVVSVDCTLLDGLVAMIQSVIEHTNSKDNAVIHIVVNSTSRQPIENRLTCSLSIPHNVQLDFVSFGLFKDFNKLIIVRKLNAHYLANQANFARFYFDQLFPDLSHVLYLDADIIVQHDIGVLWREVVSTTALLTIVHRYWSFCSVMFKAGMVDLFYERYNRNLTGVKCVNFNAGVLGFNLDKWRKDRVMDEVKYWMKQNSKKQLWGLGTQPVLHLIAVSHGYKAVDRRWNVWDMCNRVISQRRLRKSYILHWSGRDKPWHRRGMEKVASPKRQKIIERNDPYWRKYYKEECNKKGKCVLDATNGTAHCVCDSGYKGMLCME